MSNSKDFSLDKEKLTRLQEQQADAITGGGDDTEFTTPIDVDVSLKTITGGLQAAQADTVKSCCKKSC